MSSIGSASALPRALYIASKLRFDTRKQLVPAVVTGARSLERMGKYREALHVALMENFPTYTLTGLTAAPHLIGP